MFKESYVLDSLSSEGILLWFQQANFAETKDFNFQKFLARAYDDDFEQVVGVR